MKQLKKQKKQRRWIFFIIAAIVSTVALGIFYITRVSSHKTIGCKDCNILLISLDTCGAKHMSLYGYKRNTTPNFSALAKESGIVFQHAYANATWTLPSHVSIFTGLYPFIHGVNTEKDILSSTAPFLPDILHQNGYTTSFFLPPNDATLPIDNVYNRGIDSIVTDGYGTPEYAAEALHILAPGAQKNFVFFHSYYCHDPYHLDETKPLMYTSQDVFPDFPTASDELTRRTHTFSKDIYDVLIHELPIGLANGDFVIAPAQIQTILQEFQNTNNMSREQQIFDNAAAHQWWGESSRIFSYIYDYVYRGKQNWDTDTKISYLQALYDQGMTEMDTDLLSTVRTAMERSEISKNTVVIITADHGEEFMEHGAMFHSTLYDNNEQVPLVLFIPGMKATSIQEQVQSVDILPTLLDIVGIQHAQFSVDGSSLVPLIQGNSLGKRLLIANGNTYRQTQTNVFTVRSGDWKVFVKKNDDNSFIPFALYNTRQDPGEETNILAQNLERAKNLIRQYQTSIK